MTWARTAGSLVAFAWALVACSGTDRVTIGGSDLEPAANGANASLGGRAADAGAAHPTGGHDGGGAVPDADAPPSAFDASAAADASSAAGMPTAAQLLALTARCNVASNGEYAPHAGVPQPVDVCRLNGAFFWTSSMLVDCDGQATPPCASAPNRQNETAVTQSDGRPLDPVTLPFVVLPDPSAVFNYVTADIRPGAVALVLSGGSMAVGVFGDTGPSDTIGEASYAMAKSIGADPAAAGKSSGVTYIVFTGAAVPSPVEDHQAAVSLAQTLAAALVANN